MSAGDQLAEGLARDAERRRFGKYRGYVDDNEDPDLRGRLKLRVPTVYGLEISDWALPCLPFGGAAGHGLFLLPELDDMVWVEFEEGDIDRPIWTGCFWPPDSEVPEVGRRTLQTPKGHKIELIDVDDEEAVIITHCGEARVEIDPKGSVLLVDQAGATVTLDAENEELLIVDSNDNSVTLSADGIAFEDANGNKITMESAGITLEDANGNKITMASSGIKIEGSAVDVA